jgi:hypothetical protein
MEPATLLDGSANLWGRARIAGEYGGLKLILGPSQQAP